MRLTRCKASLYRRCRDVDRDFEAAGEGPYFGFTSFAQYLGWLALVDDHAHGVDLPPGWSRYETLLLVDDGPILCLGQLRFGDDHSNTTWAGHIGYSVPPSLRGRGYAKAFLRMALERAWRLGFERVMLTCDIDNAPSRAVIEGCGGEFAGEYHDDYYHKRQYWFYPGGAV